MTTAAPAIPAVLAPPTPLVVDPGPAAPRPPLGLARPGVAPHPSARVAAALRRLREHLAVGGDDLVTCASWLGDERWHLLAQTFLTSMSRGEDAGALGRWQRALLVSLHRLVSLGPRQLPGG